MGSAGLYFGRQDGIREVRASLARKLDEMQLHDDTGDPYDEGYMAAIQELRKAFRLASQDGKDQA